MRSRVLLFALVCGAAPLGSVSAAPETPEARARAVVADLVKGRYDAVVATFDKTMRAVMPADKLAAAWESIIAQAGIYHEVLAVRTQKVRVYDVVTLTSRFEQGNLDLELSLDAEGRVAGFYARPAQEVPPPKPEKPAAQATKPDTAAAEEGLRTVELTVGEGEWKLPGTLTYPKGKGPFAVVVLVHGSGPHDRDETIGPNKPFRDLAAGLARRGVACFRYEKRTQAHQAQMIAIAERITLREEVIDDAVAAAALMRKQPDINPARVFVAGHSLGAFVAPRIAVLDPKLAGAILLAGNTRPVEELVVEQMTYILSLKGSLTEADKAQLDALKKQMARLDDPKLSPSAPSVLGQPAGYWRSLRSYDPVANVRRTKQPLLILQGERDYQVTMKDFEGWRKALAGRSNVTFRSYPALNHLFMEGVGKSVPDEYARPGHVAAVVLDDIAAWVKSR